MNSSEIRVGGRFAYTASLVSGVNHRISDKVKRNLRDLDPVYCVVVLGRSGNYWRVGGTLGEREVSSRNLICTWREALQERGSLMRDKRLIHDRHTIVKEWEAGERRKLAEFLGEAGKEWKGGWDIDAGRVDENDRPARFTISLGQLQQVVDDPEFVACLKRIHRPSLDEVHAEIRRRGSDKSSNGRALITEFMLLHEGRKVFRVKTSWKFSWCKSCGEASRHWVFLPVSKWEMRRLLQCSKCAEAEVHDSLNLWDAEGR